MGKKKKTVVEVELERADVVVDRRGLKWWGPESETKFGLTLTKGKNSAKPNTITAVMTGTPASRANLKPGMRIVAVEGEEVQTKEEYLAALEAMGRDPNDTNWKRFITFTVEGHPADLARLVSIGPNAPGTKYGGKEPKKKLEPDAVPPVPPVTAMVYPQMPVPTYPVTGYGWSDPRVPSVVGQPILNMPAVPTAAASAPLYPPASAPPPSTTPGSLSPPPLTTAPPPMYPPVPPPTGGATTAPGAYPPFPPVVPPGGVPLGSLPTPPTVAPLATPPAPLATPPAPIPSTASGSTRGTWLLSSAVVPSGCSAVQCSIA